MSDRAELDTSAIDMVLMPSGFDPGGFSCEKEDMNDYLRDDAWDDMQASISQVHILYYRSYFAAFMTLSTDAIRLQGKERPSDVRYSIAPALKNGRLATCKSHEGRGIGSHLIKVAIGIARSFNDDAGVRYVTLDSHPDKVDYYKRRGFKLNQAESRLTRIWLETTRGFRKDKPLPSISMRYDILLAEETPSLSE